MRIMEKGSGMIIPEGPGAPGPGRPVTGRSTDGPTPSSRKSAS